MRIQKGGGRERQRQEKGEKFISHCESKVYVSGLQMFLFIRESEEKKLMILYAKSSICLVSLLRDSPENLKFYGFLQRKEREQTGRTFLNDKMSKGPGGNSSHKMYSSSGNRTRCKQMGLCKWNWQLHR